MITLKRLLLPIALIVVLMFTVGCSSETDREKLIRQNMLSDEAGRYVVSIYVKEHLPSIEFREKLEKIIDAGYDGKTKEVRYLFVREGEGRLGPKIFKIEKYPTFIVANSEDIVLQTTEISELEKFFSK